MDLYSSARRDINAHWDAFIPAEVKNNKNNNVIWKECGRCVYVYQASNMSSSHKCTVSKIISDYKDGIVNSMGRKLVWLFRFNFYVQGCLLASCSWLITVCTLH